MLRSNQGIDPEVAKRLAIIRQLFGVRLTLWARAVKGRKLPAGGLHAEKAWKLLNRHVEPASVGELGDDAEIRDRDLTTKRVGAWRDHGLDGLKPRHDPVRIPAINGVLLQMKRAFQIAERPRIIEWMDVAGNDLSDRSHMCASHGIGG